jgi:hypothetical protein
VTPHCCAIHRLQRRLETRGAKQGEGKTSLTTVAQSRFEVSAFQQLPHGAITPQYGLMLSRCAIFRCMTH